VLKASSLQRDDRPQAQSPEFIRRGSISRGVAMERAAAFNHGRMVCGAQGRRLLRVDELAYLLLHKAPLF